mgnify:CR=1 FL=1
MCGLMKSKMKRRWYDEHPTTHKAFSYLYMMDDDRRTEIGMKIIISVKLLEKIGEEKGPAYLKAAIDGVTRDVFNRHLDSLMELVRTYLNPPKDDSEEESTVSPRPEPAKPEFTGAETAGSSANMRYEEDADGLKLRLTGLKYI